MFDKVKFNRGYFEDRFTESLDTLKQSEAITRRELRDLSRSVLEALHMTEDSSFINRLIVVLTPVNRKVAIEYFKHFSGFHYDDKLSSFTKKNKKVYAEKAQASFEFLAEPSNNIWTWAERNIEVTAKEFTLDTVTKYVESTLKKAEKNGFNQADVMRAIIKGGMTADAIIAIMDELGYDAHVE